MRGNACCVSRFPPSPDGQPSRQITRVSGYPLESDKAFMLSWSSRFSKPEDAADLQAIFKGNNPSVENGPTSRSRDANRAKLRKRFSRDSTLTNWRSRPTVGNSDEEIARREELKRIRAKRIQEELGDNAYDDDAAPICSSPFGLASKDERDSSNDTSQDDPVNAIISAYSNLSCDLGDKQSFQERENTSNPHKLISAQGLGMPLPPVIKPKSMSDIDDVKSRHTSWRLSFTSSQRSSCLRSLNKSHQDQSGDDSTIENTSNKQETWLSKPRLHERVKDNTNIIPLHEMGIPLRLASDVAQRSPSPRQSPRKARASERVSSEEGFQEINMRRSQYFRDVLGSIPYENKIPTSWGQVQGDGASSLHTSDNVESIASTHETLRKPRASLDRAQDMDTVIKEVHVPRVVVTKPDGFDAVEPLTRKDQKRRRWSSRSKTSEAGAGLSLLPNPHHEDQVRRRQNPKLLATYISCETNQHQPLTPVTSKFKEVFDEKSPKSSIRSSLLSAIRLSRLVKLGGRSYDGEDTIDSSLVPELESSKNDLRCIKTPPSARIAFRHEQVSSGLCKGSSMESAQKMWTKAFRQSIQGGSHTLDEEFGALQPTSTDKRGNLDGTANKAQGTSFEQLTTKADDCRRHSRSAKSSIVIPPESWANYPSHTREERSTNAGSSNGANYSDFTIKGSYRRLYEDVNQTQKSNNNHQDLFHRNSHPEHLTTKARPSPNKLLTKQETTPSDIVYRFHRRESSAQASRNVEVEMLSRRTYRDACQGELQTNVGRPVIREVTGALEARRQRSMDEPRAMRGRVISESQCCQECIDIKCRRCVATQNSLDNPRARKEMMGANRREKYKTWNGREYRKKADMMALRQSTLDFTRQVEIMERFERDRALKAADDASTRSRGSSRR